MSVGQQSFRGGCTGLLSIIIEAIIIKRGKNWNYFRWHCYMEDDDSLPHSDCSCVTKKHHFLYVSAHQKQEPTYEFALTERFLDQQMGGQR